jgi:tetratricopeptide (TPR) repeat protein
MRTTRPMWIRSLGCGVALSALLAAAICVYDDSARAGYVPTYTAASRLASAAQRTAADAADLEHKAADLEAGADDKGAERLYREALETWEEARGPDNPSVASCLSRLAAVLVRQRRYDEAEPLLRRSLEIKVRVYGARSESLVAVLNNYAGVYIARGAYAAARALYLRALTIAEDSLGARHPTVGICLNNLAVLYLCEGKLAEADHLHRRAREIVTTADGEEASLLADALGGYETMRKAARLSALTLPAAPVDARDASEPTPAPAPDDSVLAGRGGSPAVAPAIALAPTSAPNAAPVGLGRRGRASDAATDGLAGPVHVVRYEVEVASSGSRARLSLARLPGPVIVYSTDGRLESRTLFRRDGTIDTVEEYRYDEKGRRVASRFLHPLKGMEPDDLDREDAVELTSTFKWDASGNRTEEAIAGEDGAEVGRWVLAYDASGRLVGRDLTVRGATRIKEVFVLDERGMVSELHEYGPRRAVVRKSAFTYELDERGNWITRDETDITTPELASRGRSATTRRKITYY